MPKAPSREAGRSRANSGPKRFIPTSNVRKGFSNWHEREKSSRGMLFDSAALPSQSMQVEQLSALVASQTDSCSVILDVGAGKGYLDQVLEYYYDRRVLNLESEQSQSDGRS